MRIENLVPSPEESPRAPVVDEFRWNNSVTINNQRAKYAKACRNIEKMKDNIEHIIEVKDYLKHNYI